MNDMINNDRIARLEQKAIDFIRNAEPLALRMDERGFHVAFSGGKDSQVLLRLVEMAGVKHHAEMQVTTVDSPNLMRFVREHYPQVKMNRPQMNMRQLIAKKGMLPTRQSRYCCAYLKEQAGAGTVTSLASARKNPKNGQNATMWKSLARMVDIKSLIPNCMNPHPMNHSLAHNYSIPTRKRRFIVSAARIRL